MEGSSNEVKKETPPQFLKSQWIMLYHIIGQPWFIIPFIIFLIVFSATYCIDNKNLSLVLYFISSVFVSIAGAIFYDTYKQISGDTVLVKKGQGAVRSLFLIVEKIKNISSVSQKRKNIEEIVNLLDLIEKDVSISIQEWTDVIPALADIEISQKIIEEKEREKAQIQVLYDEEVAAKSKETAIQKEKIADLNKLLEDKVREIRTLKLERDVTISKNISSASSGTGATGMLVGPSRVIRNLDDLVRARVEHMGTVKLE